jgi:hypothetical protein
MKELLGSHNDDDTFVAFIRSGPIVSSQPKSPISLQSFKSRETARHGICRLPIGGRPRLTNCYDTHRTTEPSSPYP